MLSEPYVTEDELKLMLRGAELSGAIEEEEQVLVPSMLGSYVAVFAHLIATATLTHMIDLLKIMLQHL